MQYFIVVLAFLLLTSVASASNGGIPDMYRLVAQENRVPAKLFFALVLNESKSLSSTNQGKKVLPWPWTINHRGKAHFFPTREKAFLFAKSLLDKGDSQFDVGLGQVNWYWHEHRFIGLWEAFDPYINLNVAAGFLREQYERPECNQWELAIGCYHRPGQRDLDKKIAKNYSKRVIAIWSNI